jgi:hypothetical protein
VFEKPGVYIRKILRVTLHMQEYFTKVNKFVKVKHAGFQPNEGFFAKLVQKKDFLQKWES